MDLDKFEKKPVLGIIRGIDSDSIKALSRTIVNSGLEAVEVTMNTPGAPEMIAKIKSICGKRLFVGAGTVLSLDQAHTAIKAGAEFIVMPVLIDEIAIICRERNVPFFPGAFTPQEVFYAWESGASMVKIFPAGLGGPKHIKSLKGPFDKIKMMAVGGISIENIEDYFKSGADAVAFGASIFDRELIEQKEFDTIERLIRCFVEKVMSNILK